MKLGLHPVFCCLIRFAVILVADALLTSHNNTDNSSSITNSNYQHRNHHTYDNI